MKRAAVLISFLMLVLGVLVVPPVGAAPAPDVVAGPGPAVYVGEVTQQQLAAVVASGVDRHELTLTPGAAPGTVGLEVVLGPNQAAALVAAGVPLSQRVSAARRGTAPTAPVFRPYSGSGGLLEELNQIARQNPNLVKRTVIGTTVQGKEIVALKVTKDAAKVPDGRRPAVLYTSAQHAREWITPEMTRRLLHYYLDNYRSDRTIRSIVDSTELWFVPVANPDGYDYTFTDGNRLWRKNLRDNDGDGVIEAGVDGVDPNRNFPTRWGYDNEGSSPDPGSETFRGTAPASEPETRALDGLMRRVHFSFLVNYHSAAELLLYGTGWQVATPTPDDLIHEAMAGDDAHPAVPGYDPDIAAELYTTNGETTEHAHEVYGTLSFTPEMATCETASAADPNDAFDPADCNSVFEFPDSEPLIQAEFAKNIPFARSVARSAADPANPVSAVGRAVPDFRVDSFKVSYGDPQPVAVTARRSLKLLTMHYTVNGGRERVTPAREWKGGERYGTEGDTYFAEYRGIVRGTKPGDRVEVWFSAVGQRGHGWPKKVASDHFTYRVAQDGGSVLVLADEDYNGVNPEDVPNSRPGPRYLKDYVDALTAAGYSSAVWDISKRGVPHDLGVLSHFDAVVWYLGDNRLTQDPEDLETDTYLFGPLADIAVAERAQDTTMAVRDYLNAGGKLALTGETAGYYGQLGTTLGGIYYGLNGDPTADCAVTDDFFSDCLLLADDFTQYYLGGWSRSVRPGPTGVTGVADPVAGRSAALAGRPTNPLDENGAFLPTSEVLPTDQFPQFAGQVSSRYTGGPPGSSETFAGEWFAAAQHADNSYMRLTRTVDLTGVAAGAAPRLSVALSVDTEEGYDNVIVEARPLGTDDWTTLPDRAGVTDSVVPAECEAGFLLEKHPFLTHYLTPGDPCTASGTTGSWHRLTGSAGGWQQLDFDLAAYAGRQVEVSISYVTDPFTGGAGLFVDDASIVIGGTVVETEGFETGLGPWSVPGAPPGSPPNSGDFVRAQSRVGASITTEDSVLLGFGLEQVAEPGQRARLVKAIVSGLIGPPS